MLKFAKKIVFTLIIGMSFSMTSFASVTDTVVDPHQMVEIIPLHVRMWSEDIYFFSMDVYETITVYSENGTMLESWSIEWLSDIQNTAWAYISYKGWPDGRYVIEMIGEEVSDKFIMLMDNGSIVLYSNNPARQQ